MADLQPGVDGSRQILSESGMAISTKKSAAFEADLRALGLGNLLYAFECETKKTTSLLMERIGECLVLLQNSSKMEHLDSLRYLATALHFSSWNVLIDHFVAKSTEHLFQRSEAWRKQLSPTLFLMVETESDIPLSNAQYVAYSNFARRLAKVSRVPLGVIQNQVCAPLCKGATWDEVLRRNPDYCKSLMYKFRRSGVRAPGGFCISETGYVLTRKFTTLLPDEFYPPDLPRHGSKRTRDYARYLDEEKWQRKMRRPYFELHKTELQLVKDNGFYKEIKKQLSESPELLEVGCIYARLQILRGEPEADKTLGRFIRMAEELIPKGYNLTIDWCLETNRFYYRMLLMSLEINFDGPTWGHINNAILLGKKMWHLDPDDHIGIRYNLALTHALL